MLQREQQAGYSRGYQDGLRNRGYNDGAVNTQGYLISFRLTFREFSQSYADGYYDGQAYRRRGHFDDGLPVTDPAR